jgi:hypothetical protein
MVTLAETFREEATHQLRTEYRDFPVRMSETLNSLEKIEKRSRTTIAITQTGDERAF